MGPHENVQIADGGPNEQAGVFFFLLEEKSAIQRAEGGIGFLVFCGRVSQVVLRRKRKRQGVAKF